MMLFAFALFALAAQAAPQRIVTLAPSLGELAADLAGGNLGRIVGVSEYTDYPPTLKHVASIGPYSKVNLERVVALKPDLTSAISPSVLVQVAAMVSTRAGEGASQQKYCASCWET